MPTLKASTMLIAIDTSVVIGLLDARDIWHSQAVALQKAIAAAQWKPVYFDCAFAEAMSTVARRFQEKRHTAEFGALLDRLLSDFPHDTFTWILPDAPRLYEEIVGQIRTFGGELNFNDALIALACRERSVPFIASFDGDFDRIEWLVRVSTVTEVEKQSQSNEEAEES